MRSQSAICLAIFVALALFACAAQGADNPTPAKTAAAEGVEPAYKSTDYKYKDKHHDDHDKYDKDHGHKKYSGAKDYKDKDYYPAHHHHNNPICKNGTWWEVTVTKNATECGEVRAEASCSLGSNKNPAATFKIGGSCTIECKAGHEDPHFTWKLYDHFYLKQSNWINGDEVQQAAAGRVGNVRCDAILTRELPHKDDVCWVRSRAFCCEPTPTKTEYKDYKDDDYYR